MRPSVTGSAPTHTVVPSALAPVQAFAMLGTVDAEGARRARRRTVLAHPPGQTLTFTGDVVTLAAVLARAVEAAVLAVGLERARMVAGQAHVTGRTNVLARDVIAGFVS